MQKDFKELNHFANREFKQFNHILISDKIMKVNTANAILTPKFFGDQYRINLTVIFKNYDLMSKRTKNRSRNQYLEITEGIIKLLEKYKFKYILEVKHAKK